MISQIGYCRSVGQSYQTIWLIVSGSTHHLTMNSPFWRGVLISWFILLLILASGCTEKSISEPALFVRDSEETEDPFYPITIDEGIILMNSRLSQHDPDINASAPIYYIEGRGVQYDGRAEQWIFGTVVNEDNHFVIVRSNRQDLVPYWGDIPKTAIDIEAVVLPEALISGNIQLLQNTFGGNGRIPLIQLELKDYTYTLTPSDRIGKIILYFNAFNGRPLGT